jgi:hypothetical protein
VICVDIGVSYIIVPVANKICLYIVVIVIVVVVIKLIVIVKLIE